MSIRHASKSVVDSLSLTRSSTYVCRQCRRNAHPSQLATQQRQFSSTSERPEDLPFAERVRRKLWKGKPPGPENVDDLYGGPGVLETMYKERKERRARGRQAQSLPTSQAEDAPTEEPRVLKKVTSGRRTDETMPMGEKMYTHFPEDSADVQSTAVAAQKSARVTTEPVMEGRPEHIPATSWEGLPLLGTTGHWRENQAKAIDEYFSWLESPIRPEWSYPELVSLMHQAIAETLAYQTTSEGASQVVKLTAESPIPLSELKQATFKVSKKGKLRVVRGISPLENISEDAIYYRRAPEKNTAKEYGLKESMAINARNEPTMTPLQPRLLYTPSDTSFLNVTLSLERPVTSILRRFSYLTNHHIPDPLLSTLFTSPPPHNTIAAFLTSFSEKIKHKPAKVAQQLIQSQTEGLLAKQRPANLLILGRRETPVDKEKEVGRWKVIERELRERGLPVLGKLEVVR